MQLLMCNVCINCSTTCMGSLEVVSVLLVELVSRLFIYISLSFLLCFQIGFYSEQKQSQKAVASNNFCCSQKEPRSRFSFKESDARISWKFSTVDFAIEQHKQPSACCTLLLTPTENEHHYLQWSLSALIASEFDLISSMIFSWKRHATDDDDGWHNLQLLARYSAEWPRPIWTSLYEIMALY